MNEKLALNDDILMKIEKPARYIGNEVNAEQNELKQYFQAMAIDYGDEYHFWCLLRHSHPVLFEHLCLQT